MRTNHANTVVRATTTNEDPKTTTPPDPADDRRVLPDAGPLPEGACPDTLLLRAADSRESLRGDEPQAATGRTGRTGRMRVLSGLVT